MLGVIGFLAAAFSVIYFAVSFERAFPLPNQRDNTAFSYALYMLAAALAIWGAAVLVHDSRFTHSCILIGELLLMAASVAMLNIIVRLSAAGTMLVSLVAAMLLGYREANLPVKATVSDNLLHFNLQGGLRTTAVLIVLAVWLPAMLVMAHRVTATFSRLSFARPAMVFYFACLAFITALFLSARRNFMIELQFAAIIILFLYGAVLNGRLGRLIVEPNQPAPAKAKATKKGSHHAASK